MPAPGVEVNRIACTETLNHFYSTWKGNPIALYKKCVSSAGLQIGSACLLKPEYAEMKKSDLYPMILRFRKQAVEQIQLRRKHG